MNCLPPVSRCAWVDLVSLYAACRESISRQYTARVSRRVSSDVCAPLARLVRQVGFFYFYFLFSLYYHHLFRVSMVINKKTMLYTQVRIITILLCKLHVYQILWEKRRPANLAFVRHRTADGTHAMVIIVDPRLSYPLSGSVAVLRDRFRF